MAEFLTFSFINWFNAPLFLSI